MSSPALPRRPGLDGLRAVAVAAVLLYHGGRSWAPGGFLGVDLFFVLSGFLITSLLLAQHDRLGRLDLVSFWGARARRLLPALVVVLLAVLWVLPAMGVSWGSRVRGDAVATTFYASNWWFIASGQSYVDQASGPSPLLHTWSLAIEEQWYLVFPLLLAAVLARLGGRRTLPWLLGGLLLASSLEMAVLYDGSADVSRVYLGTDTRVQGLLVGALAATLLGERLWRGEQPVPRLPAGVRELSPFLALAALLAAMVLARPESGWLYRGGFLLLSVLALVAVLGAAGLRPDGAPSAFARMLSWRPLVLVGLISYGIYLWHWPVDLVLDESRTGLSGTALLVVRVTVSVAVAASSYTLVERPIRRGLRGPSRISAPRWAVPAVLGVGVALAVTAALVGPLRTTTASADSLESLAQVAALLPAGPAATPPPPVGATARPGPTSRPGGSPSTRATGGPPAPAGPPRIVLVGDSQALSLFAAVKDRPDPSLSLGLVTRFGCGVVPYRSWVDGLEVSPAEPLCGDWEKARGSEIARSGATIGVLFAGGWEQYDRVENGMPVPYTSPQWRQVTRGDYERVLREILAHAPRAAVVLDHCHGAPDVDQPPATLYQWGRYPPVVNDPARVAAVNEAARAAAAAVGAGRVTVVDPNPLLCPRGYSATVDGVVLRTDGMHWSTAGAGLVWRWLRPRLLHAAGS